MTPKQRMLSAYRGLATDRTPVAPEFWYYYPAKLLGVDMIEFEREVPFHIALKSTFEQFRCEGWGAVFPSIPNEQAKLSTSEVWRDDETLEVVQRWRTAAGELTSRKSYSRKEPSWQVERPVKDLARDLPAWEAVALGGEPENLDGATVSQAHKEVGDSYLLEGWLGVPFFDFYADAREGGFQQAVCEFMAPECKTVLEGLRSRYTEFLLRTVRALCESTPLESFCLGCQWSCNSLIGPNLWRKWDKPVIQKVAEEIHRHDKLLHIHFHGRCLDTVADFAEIGVDCVCPFERSPGGDVEGLEGLREVRRLLKNKVTVNGNIHTVETLIRGSTDDVRREVREIREVFAGSNRIIIGSGDQIGRETPEENLWAMIEEATKP